MATRKHQYHALPDNEDNTSDVGQVHPDDSWWTPQRRRICVITCISAVTGVLALVAWKFATSRLHGTVYRRRPLRFTSEGTFQISVFEDLHFGENAWDTWGPQQDINSLRIMGSILDAETQNLVVLNGDLITGENTYLSNSSLYLDQIVQPIVKRGLPFASTYGNHDSAFNLSREEILARERKYPESWTDQMVFGAESGVSNYYLEVFPYEDADENNTSTTTAPTPSLILWFFDSRGGHLFQQTTPDGSLVPQPNWVSPSVVSWFRSTHASLTQKHGRTLPSLAFVHIPVNASAAFQSELGVNPHLQPGINDDYILSPQAQGWCADNTTEGCAYGGQDVPFMRAIATTPGLKVVVSGHDHGDSWCFKWDQSEKLPGVEVECTNGVVLCFGQRSGYGGYGEWERGARQILVKQREDEDGGAEVKTWIRLESGKVVGDVVLNETFGRDWYPATENTKSRCPECEIEG